MVNSSTSSSFSSDGSVSSPDLLSLYGQDPINNNNLQLLSVVVAKYCLGDDKLLDTLESKYQADVKRFNACLSSNGITGASKISEEMEDTVRIIKSGEHCETDIFRPSGRCLNAARRSEQEAFFHQENKSISLDVLKDDGAAYTTISRKLVHALKATTIKLKQPVSLGAYSGVEERATETAIVTVSFRGFDTTGFPVIAKTVVRAIVVDTLQSAILLGGNLIRKLKIEVDLDTQKVRMFRGSNLMITNCVPWGQIQHSIAETSSKVDSLCMFSASVINNSHSSSSKISPQSPSYSYSEMLKLDQLTASKIPNSSKEDLPYPISTCPKYTNYFDRNAGILSSSAISNPSSPSFPSINYESLSEALGLPS
jgi:hypothetical protein